MSAKSPLDSLTMTGRIGVDQKPLQQEEGNHLTEADTDLRTEEETQEDQVEIRETEDRRHQEEPCQVKIMTTTVMADTLDLPTTLKGTSTLIIWIETGIEIGRLKETPTEMETQGRTTTVKGSRPIMWSGRCKSHQGGWGDTTHQEFMVWASEREVTGGALLAKSYLTLEPACLSSPAGWQRSSSLRSTRLQPRSSRCTTLQMRR